MPNAPTQAPSIRDYRADDTTLLHGIDQICFPADIAFSRGELLFYVNHPDSATCIAERDGNIIGFALGRIYADRWAHVLTLDVLPGVRRQRIGTLLMDSLHDKFKSKRVTLAVLEVSTVNLSAQRLYEGLEYRVVDTLCGYYGGREDAYRMVRFF